LKENFEKMTKNINLFQIVRMGQMEQRSVVRFLGLKGLSNKVIHYEFVTVLQENVVSYSSVTRFCTAGSLSVNSEEASSSRKDQDDDLDEANETILLALSDESFSSGRQIARRICAPKALYIVGLWILCISQSDIRHLHWVSDKLSESQKATQVESSCRSNFVTSCCPPASSMDGDRY
jgi:hypothetical protein